MAGRIKIRAKLKGDETQVKALMTHDMETGTRRDAESGELIPAHFIKEVTCEHNGNVVLRGNWGTAVSKNPYLSFSFKGGAAGDTIKISWVDNKGDSDSEEAPIK